MTDETPIPTVAGFINRASRYTAEALRYWEPRRVLYNLILGAVVMGHIVAKWEYVQEMLSANLLLLFFFLAVLSNIAYCAVYAVDLFVRFSGLDKAWQKGRVGIFIVGAAFASVIAHFFSSAILIGP